MAAAAAGAITSWALSRSPATLEGPGFRRN